MDNTSLTEVLNDLIRINNDRIEGYEKAISETDEIDLDLKAMFSKMENESRDNVRELNAAVETLGETPAEGTTVSGKIYRAWMDVKTAFSNGADYIVVGRPIRNAGNPQAKAEEIQGQIASACADIGK